MRIHSIALAVAALTLGATLALAEPELRVRYPNGVPQVSITGEYPGAVYAVYRAPVNGGPWERISENAVLCMGSCYADDPGAVPGASYQYRFDLMVTGAEGAQILVYGPFLATISPALARPVGVFVFPNPGRGSTSVQLHVGGLTSDRAVPGEAVVYDLAGRQVRVIHRGTLARGLTTITWDGRDERGAELQRGVYLLRFTADGRQAIARIVRR